MQEERNENRLFNDGRKVKKTEDKTEAYTGAVGRSCGFIGEPFESHREWKYKDIAPDCLEYF